MILQGIYIYSFIKEIELKMGEYQWLSFNSLIFLYHKARKGFWLINWYNDNCNKICLFFRTAEMMFNKQI